MKIIFWISLCLPLAVLAAEDIDYFNEDPEHHNTEGYAPPGYEKKVPPPVTKKPAPTAETPSKKGWGKGIMEYFERLAAAPAPALVSTPPSTASTVTAPTVSVVPATTALVSSPSAYVQNQLKAKGQEIAHVRQQILQTTDGQKLQELTGTLHRLEGEYQQLSGHLTRASQASPPPTIELSSIGTSTPTLENIMPPQAQPNTIHVSEEDALKIQLETLEKQERELSLNIKSTPDANMLSVLASQLERVQQNKSLVTMSLQDMQRRKSKKTMGFGAALLPPPNKDIAMPVPTLTPSLEQVLPPDLPTYPAGWGGFGPKDVPAQPAVGKSMTAEEWKKVQSQAEANFETKPTHTTYGGHSRPLWTPKDLSGKPHKSLSTHAHIDHKHIVEKIRKEKIFH